jgi:hypothetical protein
MIGSNLYSLLNFTINDGIKCFKWKHLRKKTEKHKDDIKWIMDIKN